MQANIDPFKLNIPVISSNLINATYTALLYYQQIQKPKNYDDCMNEIIDNFRSLCIYFENLSTSFQKNQEKDKQEQS